MPKEKESPGGVFIQLKKAGQLPKPTDDGLLDVLENIASKPLLKIDKKAGGGKVQVELEINKLFQWYLLNGVSSFISNKWGANSTYVNPRAYTTFYSLESGASGRKTRWID